MAFFRIRPTTSVTKAGPSEHAFLSDTIGSDSLVVDDGSFLIALGASASGAFLANTRAWNVRINGSVYSELASGLVLEVGNKNASLIEVGIDGQLHGGNEALLLGSSATVTNAGVINGTVGLNIVGGNAHTIINSGTLEVFDSGSLFEAIADQVGAKTIVHNSGTIEGVVNLGYGENHLVNAGHIYVVQYAGADKNSIINKSGYIDSIDGSSSIGSTTFYNKGEVSIAQFGAGNTRIDNFGAIWNGLELFGGADSINNSGVISNTVHLGDGSNVLINRSQMYGGISGGVHNDLITNYGEIVGGDVDLKNGENRLNNYGTVGLEQDIVLYNFLAGDGFDTINNQGIIYSSISLNGGNDTFNNNGTASFVDLGNDHDIATNKGNLGSPSWIGSIIGGAGNDLVRNSGIIFNGVVDLGSGDDSFYNFIKSGNKIVHGKFEFGAVVNLGEGNDFYLGGKYYDELFDSDGSETVLLGAGNDFYFAAGLKVTADGSDLIDGGAGLDTYRISSPNNVHINLDNLAHDFSPAFPGLNLIAANTAIDAGRKDSVFNFENVQGGNGNDIIFGSSKANYLTGDSGADYLIGLGGADIFEGGNGDDVFVYQSVNDSRPGAAYRDQVLGFSSGDKIDLSAIDANVKNGSINDHTDAFAYIGANVLFSGTPGELRSYSTATGAIVEGDINGDRRADFAIMVGTQNLSAADFIL